MSENEMNAANATSGADDSNLNNSGYIDENSIDNNSNGSQEKVKDDRYRTTAVLTSILALLFAVAFIIMLILFFVRRTENISEPITFVYDENGASWDEEEEIAIFYNEEWCDSVVAPYSSGCYAFVLTNDSDYTLTYSVDLREVNEYDISMCYKLKRDGSYVVGGYVRTDDFWCNGLTIEANSSHYFELEWYWDGNVSDYNDTLAGTNEAIYTLTITIVAFVG